MQNKPSKEVLEQLINACLDKLYANDKFLIVGKNGKGYEENEPLDNLHHVGERSIVFRFAHYLQNYMLTDFRFSAYVVDCEYNRHLNEIKHYVPDGETEEKCLYPDVVVHERGSDEQNLMVMEFKTYWNDDTSNDRRKLIALTEKGEPNGNCTYGYDYGVSIVIGKTREAVKDDWYANGHEISQQNEKRLHP